MSIDGSKLRQIVRNNQLAETFSSANLIRNEILSYFDGKRDCAGAPSRPRSIPEPRDDGKQFNANQILQDEKNSEMEQDIAKLAIKFDDQADDGGETTGLIQYVYVTPMDTGTVKYVYADGGETTVYPYRYTGHPNKMTAHDNADLDGNDNIGFTFPSCDCVRETLCKVGLVVFVVIRMIVSIIALVALIEIKSIWSPFDDDAIKEQCNGELQAFLYAYGRFDSPKVHPDVYLNGWMYPIFIAMAFPLVTGSFVVNDGWQHVDGRD
eukprot:110774_1